MSNPQAAIPLAAAHYPRGVAMVLAAGLCLSFGGLILRHIEQAEIWTVSFYRSVFFVATLLVFLLVTRGRDTLSAFRAIGWDGVVVAVAMAGGSTLYILALSLTTVANVMFILSTSPLLTALLGRLVLGERIGAVTWVAMLAALAGIAIMVADGLEAGALLGNLTALGAVVAFAIMITALRRGRHVDMVPATCLGGALAALLALAMAGSLVVTGHDLGFCFLLGSLQLGGGFLLITLGSRYVPAGEVALLVLLEVVLAPIWVWIWIDEVPRSGTLLGGGLVLAAVLAQALRRLWRDRATAAA